MSDDSQEYYPEVVPRTSSDRESDSIASMSSGEEIYDYDLFATDDNNSLFSAYDWSVFEDPCPIPPSVLKLIANHALWEPLEQSEFNDVSKTSVTHPYPRREEGAVVIKKSCFPPKDIYLYHSQELTFTIQIGHKFYLCVASAEKASFGKLSVSEPVIAALCLERKHAKFFVLNPSGLYRVTMTREWVSVINTNAADLDAIKQILTANSRALAHPLLKLTSQSVAQIQKICPVFAQGFDPAPLVYRKKTRSARLLSDFYPELPVYAVDECTLVMPHFDEPATVEEIIQEVSRIFLTHRRIVADMSLMKNFKKDPNGKIYCTEPDLAFSAKKRVSKGSLFIEKNIVSACFDLGQFTPYQRFLATVKLHSEEESKLVQITLALLYLAEVIDDCDDIDNDWVNEDWLQLVYVFSTTRFPLELSDLEVMHTFGSVLDDIYHGMQLQDATGYRIYYRCIENFIQREDSENLRTFLNTLSVETAAQVLKTGIPQPLLSTAVLTNNLMLVRILLEFDADPLLEDLTEAYSAIDWALFNGSWEILTSLLNAETRTVSPTVNSHVFWSSSSPKTHITTQNAVTAMSALAAATQFQSRLKTIKDLALNAQSQAHLNVVHSLLRTCKVYFEHKDEELAYKKKVFIKSCNRLLRQSLPNLSSELATITLQTAILELKNALSLARDPTFSCSIS